MLEEDFSVFDRSRRLEQLDQILVRSRPRQLSGTSGKKHCCKHVRRRRTTLRQTGQGGATHVPDVDLVARRQHTRSGPDRHACKGSRSARNPKGRCSTETVRAGAERASTKGSRAATAVSAPTSESTTEASASGSAAEAPATAASCRRETVLANFKHRALELEAVVHG